MTPTLRSIFRHFSPYKIEMQKQVPVFYDDIQVPDVVANLTIESSQQDWSINVMEIMRLTTLLRKDLPSFTGIQKTQVQDDKVLFYSSST
jgi:hypothetical protein